MGLKHWILPKDHFKTHLGTLNTNEASGRKMKSPPGDIFIYGVHPDTTEDDIVNDLKASDIIIEVKDVVKKSRPDAGLNSYKISVKAEDLQKALDTSIWPLRVKVREYIYYSRKPQLNGGQRGQGGGQYGGYNEAQGGQGGRQYQGPLGPQGGQYGGHNGAQEGQVGEQYQSNRGSQWGQGGGQYREHQGAHLRQGGDHQLGHLGGQEGVPTFNRFAELDTQP